MVEEKEIDISSGSSVPQSETNRVILDIKIDNEGDESVDTKL